jgi:microcystin-dependent protein
MSQPYIGEIRMFAGNFAPVGWAFCSGQLLPISENDALFNLIGTTYGGDGQETFALPDLQSRLPIHQGQGPGLSNYVIGQPGGVEQVTLTVNQTPIHSHPMLASTSLASDVNPAKRVVAQPGTAGNYLYLEDTPSLTMAATAISSVGGSQPHSNLQPFLCINFIIALFGVFPTPT